MLAALTRAMFHLATGTAHLAGTIAVVYVVSRLVTGGDATHAPAYRHSPTAERILLSTATYAPAIHQSATRLVGDYCATELNVEGFGQTYLAPTHAQRVATDLGIPFTGATPTALPALQLETVSSFSIPEPPWTYAVTVPTLSPALSDHAKAPDPDSRGRRRAH
eukprot:scaffold5770_cov130-Isochrysis_galbana.AAC.2